MDKRITIYKGNEYKAKEEKAFRVDDVFADVYLKACSIINEITREMQEYEESKQGKERKKYAARYADLGKNMIIFCGTRGQGKTSAMRSFARLLREGCREEKFEEQIPPALVSQIKEGAFEVLDPIDPSAMENDESVLRVLISRLFYQLQERIKGGEAYGEDDHEFIRNKTEIVKLFQKCYVNIDYIKSGKGKDVEQDDLEMLAQLGSSAKLKENLHELIEKYLRFIGNFEKSGRRPAQYLVVPVDDADLATKKVFRLCEDIRNYLSIPNVVIVMAADYDQLVYATFQKYLKQNKVRIQTEYSKMRAAESKLSQDADGISQVADDCYKMAAKYLEKVFPVGHRVDLPDMNELLTSGNQQLLFYYMVQNERTGKEEAAFPEIEDCNDIQEQLLRLLYSRTGIVLKGHPEHMHIFLPHTFRELTHMVKLFYDMHDINCDRIYVDYYQYGWTSKIELELHRLRENIQEVKRYFLNYWCGKNLTDAEVRVLREIDQVNSKSQMTGVHNIFCKYLRKQLAAKATYRGILQGIAEEELNGQPAFQEAVFLYYSLFLNDWFVASLEQYWELENIAEFVETPLEVSEDFIHGKIRGQLSFYRFRINTKDLADAMENNFIPAACTFLDNMCNVIQDGEIVRSQCFSDWVDQDNHLDVYELQELEFDIFRPLMAVLRRWLGTEAMDDEEEESITEGNTRKQDEMILPYVVSIRNIIANCDVQVYLRQEMESWYKSIKGEEEAPTWKYELRRVYGKIDNLLSRIIYWTKMMRLEDLLSDVIDNEYLLVMLILSNEENRNNFMELEIELSKKALPEMEDKLAAIARDISSQNAQKQAQAVIDAQNLLERMGTILREVEDEEAKGILVLYDKTGRWDELRGLYAQTAEIKKKLQNLLSNT